MTLVAKRQARVPADILRLVKDGNWPEVSRELRRTKLPLKVKRQVYARAFEAAAVEAERLARDLKEEARDVRRGKHDQDL